MDIRRLQAFAKVHELRSFSRAGEELALSQPTISAHIQALEEELGTPLFDRLGRTTLPTRAGDVLMRYCATIFTQLDHARAEILAIGERVAGELVIGGSTIPSQYIIPRLASRFVARHPEARVSIRGGDSMTVAAMVAEGEVDVGIIGAVASQADLTCSSLLDDALMLVAPVHAPVRNREGDAFRAWLLSLPWIMRESGSGTRRTLEAALAGAGIEARSIRPVARVDSTLAALECVAAGLGVSAVSSLAAAPYLERGTVRRLAAPELDMRRQFFVVRHGRRHVFPALRRFLDLCGAA